ncbi:MAG: PTS sugar transporter subunit IIA [Hydrogenophilus sp.]|nr:PTS sugar transporter subunit IIA [Hydrogenophilus sp.]
MALAELLDDAHIALDLPVPSKKRLLEALAQLFTQDGLDLHLTFQALLERERLGTTGLGNGVAIPHARLAALDAPRVALVRTAQPVPFDALDGQPVRLALALLVPNAAHETHLALLAEIAERLDRPEVRAALLAASTPSAVRAALTAS